MIVFSLSKGPCRTKNSKSATHSDFTIAHRFAIVTPVQMPCPELYRDLTPPTGQSEVKVMGVVNALPPSNSLYFASLQCFQHRSVVWVRQNARKAVLPQKYPQYCWEFHDQLSEALFRTISEKEASPAVLRGREFWKCSGSLKYLES